MTEKPEHEELVNLLRAKAVESERFHIDAKTLAGPMRDAATVIAKLDQQLMIDRSVPHAVARVYELLQVFDQDKRNRILRAASVLLAVES